MLTIGKLGATRKQLEYYEQQVAAGIEDYYSGRGEAPGRWRGTGAEALGLTSGSEVDRPAFMALMHGRHPCDGTVLRAMGTRSKVAALDLTFSAPKSVSVLFAVSDSTTDAALLEAHECAVDEALAYLERQACWTRRGHGGAERLRGEGLIAASYRHRMSRAGDPQLHTHVVVANMTKADGRYTALDAHSLYEHKSAAGALYRAVLRREVRERLPWVSWRQIGRGLFEIEGIPELVLRHFSQRRAEIEERAMALVGAGELSRERMQGIALATRRAKQYGVNGLVWREQAQARAAEHGLGRAELAALQSQSTESAERPDLEQLFSRLSGPEGLTQMHNAFERRHALAEIAGAFRQGTTATELEHTTSRYLEDSTVQVLGSDSTAGLRYTTGDLLAREREIIGGAERRRGAPVGVLSPALVDRVLSRWSPALNNDQAAAVRALALSGRGIDVVEALAGTGKTTLIGALAACYQLAGWRVIGAAPTGRAARQLREVAEIPAATMHSLLGELDQAGGFGPRTALVLDEAGMAPTRLTARLFAHAERAGIKVIAVGDPGQLGSVEAGGWLATLARQQPAPQLREVMRQRDPDERAVLETLRDGEPERYLSHKQDAIEVHATDHEAVAMLVEQWDDARRQYGLPGAVMITRDNHTRERLNQAARDHLKQDGVLPASGVIVGGREFAVGDRVIARRNDRQLDIDNGTLATVIEIDPVVGRMHLQTDSGELRQLDRVYVADHVEYAYALTGHGAQGGTVTWVGVVGRPEEFTREWAYTALSRAREQTVIHVISERSGREREREHYGPAVPDRDRTGALRALLRTMKRSETERLALEQAQPDCQLHRRLAEAAGAHHREFDRLAQLDVQDVLRRPYPRTFRGPPSQWSSAGVTERGRVLEL